MDAISYAHSAKQEQRIKKFINDPDSTSGVLTVPKVIASGESVTIPAGRVAILPDVQVDGTLNVLGDIFIPTGTANSKVVQKVASTDNAIVRFNGTTGDVQSSGVIVDDDNNIGIGMTPTSVAGYSITSKNGTNGAYEYYYTNGTQSAYIGGYNQVLNLGALGSSSLIQFQTNGAERMRIDSNGNVGIGLSTPKARLDVYTLGISGGLPATTGNAQDPNVMARFAGSSVCMDFGTEATGHQWIQCRNLADYSVKYNLHLQPNGGNVGIGISGNIDKLGVKGNAAIISPVGTTASDGAGVLFFRGADQTQMGYIGFGSPTTAIEFVNSKNTGFNFYNGDMLQRTAYGIGYGTGAGIAVTQLTSKFTAVSVNKPTGQITTASDALASGSFVQFLVNNSLVTASDTVHVNVVGGTGNVNAYRVHSFPIAGGFYISIKNETAGSLSDAIVIKFNVIKGANS